MRRVTVGHREARLRLEASISGLATVGPQVSARTLLTRRLRLILLASAVAITIGCLVSVNDTAIALVMLCTLTYLMTTGYRFYLFLRSTRAHVVEQVSDDEARAMLDSSLPFYSLLIPAYHEPEVINQIIHNLGRMEYPVDKLEILVLVEEDDRDTIEAIGETDPGEQFRLVLVPPSVPRTKPKALNYGLTLAKGELVAVYDVEDQPDLLQLRRAAVAMARLGPDVGCIQAKLSYANPSQNLITRWFTIEYAMWFSLFLPGLASMRAPIPLGGTSNHFRRSVLRILGAWDPYNVTEDADLGIRMHREGFSIRILESTTLEEANSDFVNWMKQRSRWYKGYLQTFFVHLRHPWRLRTDLGLSGLVHFCLFVGGTPVLALINPIFWALTVIWFVAHPQFIQQIFPAPLYYLGLFSFVFGNFALYYLTILSCRIEGKRELLWAALVIPVYWLMMSLAAVKALVQLVAAPNYWEKTAHGLDLAESPRLDVKTELRV
jgi:cellulose synthase/poly-beta-1,6-N-acetylglucosamine synthase-like glycosyltransferase